jgi:hypothetical protein
MLTGPRPLCACAIVCLSVVAAGCGSVARPPVQVRLELSGPVDGTRVTSDSIVVSGNVSPAGATVTVIGRNVPVSRGSFTTRVRLRPGTNLVDVLAGVAHAQAAMTAARVFRQVYLQVPDVSGDSADGATRALRAIGLVPRIQNDGEFFDFLLPTSPQVCGTSPGAGQSVLPDSVVTVTVSKTC